MDNTRSQEFEDERLSTIFWGDGNERPRGFITAANPDFFVGGAHALLYYKRKWTLFEMKYADKKKKRPDFDYMCWVYFGLLWFFTNI